MSNLSDIWIISYQILLLDTLFILLEELSIIYRIPFSLPIFFLCEDHTTFLLIFERKLYDLCVLVA